MRWFVALCAAAALLATRTGLYVPLPADAPQSLVIACFVVLPFAFGLAVGRWWAVLGALALVVLPTIRTDAIHLLFLVAGMLAVALLIATGVVSARYLPRSRLIAVPLAIAGLLPLAAGTYRTIDPYDHVPARPIAVDERIGRMGSVRLGDEQLPERRDLAGYTAHAANGRVSVITSGNPRVQTRRGVGNGDNLALVEQRHPSARCIVTPPAGEWGETRYCILRTGRIEVQFFDDPIRSVTVQRPSS